MWGPDTVTTRSTLSELAETYRLEGDFAQAESLYKQILSQELKSNPRYEGMILGAFERLADLYAEEGKDAEAESVLKEAIEFKGKDSQPGDLSLIASQNGLALFYEHRGRMLEAEEYYRRALDQFGSAQPSGNSLMDHNLSIVMRNYARLLRKTNRPEEAAEYEASAKKIAASLAPKPLKK